MDFLYLDNNATTQPAPEVVEAMNEALCSVWANPSSVHRFGQMARQRVELARAAVAGLIGARDREVVFTSGGTESNNLALWGVLGRTVIRSRAEGGGAAADGGPRGVLITTKIEHSAIREPAQALAEAGVEVVYVPVDRNGWVDPEGLAAVLGEHAGPGRIALVSIQWANNETGVIQSVDELAGACREYRGRFPGAPVVFHVDATQAVGKLSVDVRAVPVDLMTFSAHKFHGPKGVGGLYVRSGLRLQALLRGGPQERERRGGTENTAGIIGMGVAAELAQRFLGDTGRLAELAALRDRFEGQIVGALPDTQINSKAGPGSRGVEPPRLWNTSNLGFPKVEAEGIIVGLSERGVCASAGAACSSGSLEPSPVLLAMGIPETVAHGSIRFSLSRYTTAQEIDRAVPIVVEVVQRLRKTLPVSA